MTFNIILTEFKCLKDKWRYVLLTIYYVIIKQKTMSSRKSEEDVMNKFGKS